VDQQQIGQDGVGGEQPRPTGAAPAPDIGHREGDEKQGVHAGKPLPHIVAVFGQRRDPAVVHMHQHKAGHREEQPQHRLQPRVHALLNSGVEREIDQDVMHQRDQNGADIAIEIHQVERIDAAFADRPSAEKRHENPHAR
jgi:hypothetical protein